MSSPSFNVSAPPSPSPDFSTADSENGNRLSAFNPFTMVFVGVAYVIIFVYIIRFVLSLVRNLIHRGRFGRWAGTDEAGTEVASIRSESLPSFYKVVVLPDKDVCYGISTFDQKQSGDGEDENAEQNAKNQELRLQFLGQQDNQSEIDHHNPEYNYYEDTDDENDDDVPIRFFRTASITLEPDFDTNIDDEKSDGNYEIYYSSQNNEVQSNQDHENENQNVEVFVDIPNYDEEEEEEDTEKEEEVYADVPADNVEPLSQQKIQNQNQKQS